MLNAALASLAPYSLVIKAVLGLSIILGSAYFGYDYRDKQLAEEELKEQEARVDELLNAQIEIRVLQGKLESKASEYEVIRSDIELTSRSITQVITHETQLPVYNDPDCRVPPSGVFLLQDARQRFETARSSGGAVKPAPEVP